MEVCRLCLKESYQLLSIFEYKNTEQITKTIMTTIPEIRIFKTDQLSKYICIDCYKVIINFQVLKELSLKNDKLQKSLLIDTKPFNIKIEHEDGIDDSSIVFSYNSYLDNNDEGGDDDNEYLSSKYDLKPLSVNLERLSDIKTQVQTGSKRKRNDDATVREQEILKLKCDLCAKSFRNRGQLENHMSRHLNNDDDVFSCHVCLRMFQRRDSLLAHIRRTHDMYAGHLRCDLCMCEKGTTKMFRLKAKLETHMMVEHLGVRKCSKGSKYFQCSDCSTTYSLFRDLQSHAFFVHNKIINEEPEKRLKKCRFCDETFPTKHQLSCHYDHVHAEERKKHPCSICSQAFMSEDRLEWHIKKIHGTCQRKCTICNIEFSQKRDFVLHKYFHCDYLTEYNEPIKFECILCSFYTFDQEQLYNHLPSHLKDFEQNDKMIIVCINCSKIIDNFDVLHTHTGEHNENITHKCLKCEKKFVMGTKLLKHLMKHDEVVMKLCPYENCKYKSSEKFKLDAHILHKHKNIVSHLCNICGNSFSSRGTLKAHIMNLHEDNKTLKCNLCAMTFRVAAHLRNHQAVHSNEYTFKCDHEGCTKVFKAKRNLLRHKNFHDPSKLNYKHQCTFENCDKKFLKRHALTRHLLSHTKVKPYECTWDGCDRAFSQSNDLHKHLKQHFGHDRVHRCSFENCQESFRLKSELRLHEAIHYVS